MAWTCCSTACSTTSAADTGSSPRRSQRAPDRCDCTRRATVRLPARLAPHGWWLHGLHRELIGLRRRNPWLARGHIAVLAKDCTWIDYETTAPGHRLQAHLELDPRPAARLVVDGAVVFDWPR
nr:hypothetical protein [Propionibacterium australiense]